MIDKGIWMLLTQDPGVSAIVGSGVYWILQPKGTSVPSVVLDIIATNDFYANSGVTGLREMVLQIDCYASDHYSSRGLSQAVRLLLENYVGNLPDTDATPVIAAIISKDWTMPFEPGAKGFIYRSLLEVRLHYIDGTLPISTPSNPEAVVDGGTSTADDSQ